MYWCDGAKELLLSVERIVQAENLLLGTGLVSVSKCHILRQREERTMAKFSPLKKKKKKQSFLCFTIAHYNCGHKFCIRAKLSFIFVQ